MSEALTCGTCRHWRELPRDVNNLGAPQRGECREGPPSVTILPVPGPAGSVGQMALSGYPSLERTFPACGRHEARPEA